MAALVCIVNSSFYTGQQAANLAVLFVARSMDLGAVHTKTLFCENVHVLHRFGRPSIRILKTQRLKTYFFETGSQGREIRKRSFHFHVDGESTYFPKR